MTDKNLSGDVIILINPPLKPGYEYVEEKSSYPPMGILSIGTVLDKAGYKVAIVDGAVDSGYILTLEKIFQGAASSGGRIIFAGLSVMTSQILPALEISEKIRGWSPSVPIVWGGIHPTLFPLNTCQHELVDIVVVREGEMTALDLAEAIKNGQTPDNVKGIFWKDKKGKIHSTPERELTDINVIPPFNFDILSDINRYINYDMSFVGGRNLTGGATAIRKSLPVLAGLGCPYRCAFCINAILKKKYRYKKAELIISEIETLMEKYGANDFGMIDEDFFASRARVEEFLELVEKKGLKFSWHTSTRANYFTESYINEKFLRRLRNSGFFHFGLGAESGSRRILKFINKGITPEQVENVAVLSKRCGVNVGFSFMCALPTETTEEFHQTIRFCYKLIRINPDNYIIGPQVFRPYPGSPLYDIAVKFGLKVPEGLQEWGRVYNEAEGYFKLESLPWVKNPETIRKYLFYLQFVFQKVPPRSYWKKFLFPVLKFLCSLRFRLNIFIFPFEYVAFKRILKQDV